MEKRGLLSLLLTVCIFGCSSNSIKDNTNSRYVIKNNTNSEYVIKDKRIIYHFRKVNDNIKNFDETYLGWDYWQTPNETVLWGMGDCEDKVRLLKHRLEIEGYNKDDLEFVVGDIDINDAKKWKEKYGKIVGHVWLEYTNDKEVYILDPTRDFINKRSLLGKEEYVRWGKDHPAYHYIQMKLKEYNKRVIKLEKNN